MKDREIQKAKLYTLESITNKMKKEFGSISKGQESDKFMQLFVMEEVLLKAYLKNSKINSRRAKEAINICLLNVKGYLNNIEYDFTGIVDHLSLDIADRLSKTFIPFENNELYAALKGTWDFSSTDSMKIYFTEAIQCLIRIYDSVEYWEKAAGLQGYFEFLKGQIMDQIYTTSDKVHFFGNIN